MRCAEKVAAAYQLGKRDAIDAAREAVAATKADTMSEAPPTGAEWVEAIVKALHLGYHDALDDVQDRLKDMGQVWCNAHGSHVSRNDVHLLLDELRKP